MSEPTPQPLLVVGAGIAGVTAAIEAAEAGRDVVLLEREASIGGRVLQLHHYFPKLCPPSCGMEINTRRLERNPRVRVLTRSEIASAENGKVTVRTAPAYVNDRCTACGKCSEVCPAKVKNPHNLGMDEAKIAEVSKAVLEEVGLTGKEDVMPFQLSRGERQRRKHNATLTN